MRHECKRLRLADKAGECTPAGDFGGSMVPEPGLLRRPNYHGCPHGSQSLQRGANIRDDGISSGGGGGDDDDGIELDTAFKSRHPTSPRYWDRVQQQSRAPQSDNTNDGGGKLLGGALSGPLA